MKKFQFIIMVNGMIYVNDLIFHQLEKLVKHLSLQRSPAPIGEEIQKMKCYKGYTEHVGVTKKN